MLPKGVNEDVGTAEYVSTACVSGWIPGKPLARRPLFGVRRPGGALANRGDHTEVS